MRQALRCSCGAILTTRDVIAPGLARCGRCGKEIKLPRPKSPPAPEGDAPRSSPAVAPGAPISAPDSAARPAARSIRPTPSPDAGPDATISCPRCSRECGIADPRCPRCGYDFKTGGGGVFMPYVEPVKETSRERFFFWLYANRAVVITMFILVLLLILGWQCSAISAATWKLFT